MVLLITSNCAFGQKYDYIWITGYATSDSLEAMTGPFGTTYFDFNYSPVKIYRKWIDMSYREANITIADKKGNILFTTNVMKVRGKNGKFVGNGDSLLYDKAWFEYGYRAAQGVLALPEPSIEYQFRIIYGKKNLNSYSPIYSSIYDSRWLNGLLPLNKKNVVLFNDPVAVGRLVAVRHANGRDWWIHTSQNFDTHYMILLDTFGIRLHHKQKLGYEVQEGIGQATFSPDGSKFAQCQSVSQKVGQDLVIFDFDRCSGLMSNPVHIHHDSSHFVGCAISPNSRFLYYSGRGKVVQYDLSAADIKASETIVGVWDNFIDIAETDFYLSQLGPDGKIYICTFGSTPWMHYINKPDEKGVACDFRLRGIKLPTANAWTLPNHPNYRLGALKGSPCDTLHSIAVKEKEISLQATLFPNPTSDQVTIKWQKMIRMRLVRLS
ncbi:MAG: hypothetical protein ACOYOA_10645 [Saprospiraceae bacterium]